MTTFSYQGQDIPIIHKTNKRSKRLTLRFSPKNTSFILSSPPRISDWQIGEFLKKCKGWAEKLLEVLDQKIQMGPGKIIHLHGNPFECVADPLRKKPYLCRDSQTLFLPHKWTSQDLQITLKNYALEILTPYVRDAALHLDKTVREISVRDTKSRWGSCSTTQKISLSWRLILAPPEVAQYVCIHEAAHLIHMNHSREFWNIVESLCPDFRSHKKWLRDNGPSLMF